MELSRPNERRRGWAEPERCGSGDGTCLDTLAALVPAEALALYAGFVIPYTTKTAPVHGTDVTVISDPALLQ